MQDFRSIRLNSLRVVISRNDMNFILQIEANFEDFLFGNATAYDVREHRYYTKKFSVFVNVLAFFRLFWIFKQTRS